MYMLFCFAMACVFGFMLADVHWSAKAILIVPILLLCAMGGCLHAIF